MSKKPIIFPIVFVIIVLGVIQFDFNWIVEDAFASTDSAKTICEKHEGKLHTIKGHRVTSDYCDRISIDVCEEIDGDWQLKPRCNEYGMCTNDMPFSCLIFDQERFEKEVAEFRFYDQIFEAITIFVIIVIIFSGFVLIFFIWKRKRKGTKEE